MSATGCQKRVIDRRVQEGVESPGMDLVNPLVRRMVEDGEADPEGFWARAAAELPWFRGWDAVFEPDPPTFRWFGGAQTNLPGSASTTT